MPLYGKHTFAQWYTLGDPFVRRHNGRYYCFFSEANFLTDRYGVDYCGANHITGPYADSGSDAGARVLHSVPVHVRGARGKRGNATTLTREVPTAAPSI